MVIICPPITAATDRLHLGNLYNWVLIDVYKRGAELMGDRAIARETWNCYSKKLEEKIVCENPGKGFYELSDICKRETERNISNGKTIFEKYSIKFDSPEIRDDSYEYKKIVGDVFERYLDEGRVTKNLELVLPSFEKVYKLAKEKEWVPSGSWRRLKEAGFLKNLNKISLSRKGFYGISHPLLPNGHVFGQRFVQSLLPSFYNSEVGSLDVGIFGGDLLIKWGYFMMANNNKDISKYSLLGMMLDESGKKIRRSNDGVFLIGDLNEDSNNVRLGMIKQSFGNSFRQPTFSQERKFVRKVQNCFEFLYNHVQVDNNNGLYDFSIGDSKNKIGKAILDFNFKKGYELFRKFIYDDISKNFIGEVKLRGVSKDCLESVVGEMQDISRVFVPRIVGNFESPHSLAAIRAKHRSSI